MMGLSIPLPDRRQSAIESHLQQLSKKLHEFENLYDEDEEDAGGLLEDVTHLVNNLEGGQIKVQMKSFINKYREISTNLKEVNEERDEVLSSLADWFNVNSHDMNLQLSYDQHDEDSISNSLVSTKLGFEKLRRLDETISGMKLRGGSTHNLVMEKNRLQKDVLMNFSAASKRSSQESSDDVKNQLEATWTNAAKEIVDLLKHTRKKGEKGVTDLENRLRNLLGTIEDQTKLYSKAKAELEEQKLICKRWGDENHALRTENLELKEKLTKIKAKYKQLAQKKKQDSLHKTSTLSNEDQEDTVYPVSFSRSTKLSEDPTILKAQLKDAKNRNETLCKELAGLQDKVSLYEALAEEKDLKIDELELDKSELLQQMKKCNVSPDVRNLSNCSFNRSVSGFSLQVQSPESKQLLCANCHQRTMTKASNVNLVPQNSITYMERRAAELEDQVKDIDLQLTASVSENERLHNQLNNAYQEIQELQQKESMPLAPYPTPVPTAMIRAPTNHQQPEEKELIDVSTSPIRISPDLPEVPSDLTPIQQSPIPTADKVASVENRLKSKISTSYEMIKSMMQATEKPNTFEVRSSRRRIDDSSDQIIIHNFEVAHRGMQTDPAMDNLGAWSLGAEVTFDVALNWMPPNPPSTWISFDPTGQNLEGGQRLPNVGVAMLHGVEPRNIHDMTCTASGYVQKELDRIIQGIHSFVSYSLQILNREAENMHKANKKLKKYISPTESLKLNKAQHAFNMDIFNNIYTMEGPMKGRKQTLPGLATYYEMNDNEVLLNKVKNKVLEVRNHAIQILKNIQSLVFSGMQSQQKEYEVIFSFLQSKPDVFISEQTDRKDDSNVLKLSESLTVRPLSVSSQMTVDDAHGSLSKVQTRSSHSAGSLLDHRSKVFMPSVPTSGSAAREEFKVAKATVPKKGLIQLTALNQDHHDPNYYDRLRHEQRQKSKPSPISHKKIMEKQRKFAQPSDGSRTNSEGWSRLVPEKCTVEELQRSILQFDDYIGANRNPYLNFRGDLSPRTANQPGFLNEASNVDPSTSATPPLPPIHITLDNPDNPDNNTYPAMRT